MFNSFRCQNAAPLQTDAGALGLLTASSDPLNPSRETPSRIRSSASGALGGRNNGPMGTVVQGTSQGEPGNSAAEAMALGRLSGSRTVTDAVSSLDRNDFFKFSIGQAGAFNLRLTGMTADADVQLLGGDGRTVLATAQNSGAANESMTRNLTAGDYYVRVYQYSGNTNYSLSLSAPSAAPTPAPSPAPTPTPTPTGDSAFVNRVLQLTNQFRAQNGVASLRLNTELNATALGHSRNMAQQDFFSHTGRDGSQPWDRARRIGYEANYMGENIAAGQRTADEVVQGWINSPGHRANLLNRNYTELGVGYYYQANDTGTVNYNRYWTQVFGSGDRNPASYIPA